MEKIFLKVPLFGDRGVGKRSLVYTLQNGKFKQTIPSTKCGIELKDYELSFGDLEFKLLLWNFLEIEKYKFLLPEYLRGVKAYVLSFDLSQPTIFEKEQDSYQSVGLFERLEKHMEYINEHLLNAAGIVIGTKLDKGDLVYQGDIDDFLEKHGFSKEDFFRISAKDGYNIKEPFKHLISKVVHNAISEY